MALIKKYGNTGLYVVEGDITQILTDAIMVAINSNGAWFGGVDRAIMRVADEHYHAQAGAKMPLRNLQTIIAKGNCKKHRGKFNDVVFVVDDLESPVSEVVYSGLVAADKEGYCKLLLPAVRMGVMLGAVEKTPEETVDGINNGVKRFMQEYSKKTKLQDLTFVVYRDRNAVAQLENRLGF